MSVYQARLSVSRVFACVYEELMRCIETQRQNETTAAHKGEAEREKSLQKLISHAAYSRNTEQGSFLSRFQQVCFLQGVCIFFVCTIPWIPAPDQQLGASTIWHLQRPDIKSVCPQTSAPSSITPVSTIGTSLSSTWTSRMVLSM